MNFGFGLFAMFYAMTNLVPANVQKFKMSWQASGDRVLEMYFEKKGNKWQMSNGKNDEDNVLLWSNKQGVLNVDIKHESDFMVPLSKYLGKRDHQNWHKLSYFHINDENDSKIRLNVYHSNKLIRIKKANEDSENFDKEYVYIKLSWQ